MNNEDEQRIYILASKVLYESPNFDKMLSNFQILCKVYSYNNSDDNKMKSKIVAMITKIKKFRKHEIMRNQDIILSLKVDSDDLIAEMLKDINPRNMLPYPIYDGNSQ